MHSLVHQETPRVLQLPDGLTGRLPSAVVSGASHFLVLLAEHTQHAAVLSFSSSDNRFGQLGNPSAPVDQLAHVEFFDGLQPSMLAAGVGAPLEREGCSFDDADSRTGLTQRSDHTGRSPLRLWFGCKGSAGWLLFGRRADACRSGRCGRKRCSRAARLHLSGVRKCTHRCGHVERSPLGHRKQWVCTSVVFKQGAQN